MKRIGLFVAVVFAAFAFARCFTKSATLDQYCQENHQDAQKMNVPCGSDDECCHQNGWQCRDTNDGSGQRKCQLSNGSQDGGGVQCATSFQLCGPSGQQCCEGLACENQACCTLLNDCSHGEKCCGNRQCVAGTCMGTTSSCSKSLGQTCSSTAECCDGNSCDGSRCCRSSQQACPTGNECCAGLVCNVVHMCSAACKVVGDTCALDADCCSGQCFLGRCDGAGDGGTAPDVTCGDSTDCNGAMTCPGNYCQNPPYNDAGFPNSYVCGADPECATSQCMTNTCHPAADCQPEGAVCADETDCCGSLRCQGGNCLPPKSTGVAGETCYVSGSKCKAGDRCCSGVCQLAVDHTCQ